MKKLRKPGNVTDCMVGYEKFSLRASSPIWANEANLATRFSLAQIGELARRL